MDVVREPPGARAEHEHAARRRIAQRGVHDLERRGVLLFAPRPVAVKVRVVGREALVDRQPRAQRKMRLDGCAVAADRERREQRAEPPAVILDCARIELQTRARQRA